MIALALSGITAFPLETELHWLLQFSNHLPAAPTAFITKVYEALQYTNQHYPMLGARNPSRLTTNKPTTVPRSFVSVSPGPQQNQRHDHPH